MAIACGVSVANGYYNQPLLGTFATYFQVEPWKASLVATAAQVGYGSGILFFLPLGDLMERRRLIVSLVYVCVVCLVAMAVAPTLPLLIVAQLLVGLSAISPQILIPLGSEMVPVEQRGKLIGALISGLLCGVLLARTLAGFVADHFGWRALYALAALLMLVLGFALSRSLLRHRVIVDIARRHDATPAQVCLAWVLRQEGVLAIPKASDKAHVQANAAAADLRLNGEDLQAIDAAFSPATTKQPLALL